MEILNSLTPELIEVIITFSVLQGINVVLNTLKTLIMTKKDSVFCSAVANAVAFGFYSIVVSQLATVPTTITVPATAIMNFIGVYISYWVIGKTKKDSLWKIEVYQGDIDKMCKLHAMLQNRNMSYITVNSELLNVYCYTQEQSATLKACLQFVGDCKSNIVEISKTL